MKLYIVLLVVAALQVCAVRSAARPGVRLDDGHVATRRQFPWHVLLKPSGIGVTFAGMVLTDSWVLTCAACANKAPSYDLIFGAFNVSDDAEANRQMRTVSKTDFILHEDFDPGSFNVNNLALIPLAEPILLNAYVSPLLLPPLGTTDTYAGEIVRSQGYGKDASDPSLVLRYTDLEVRPNSGCTSVGFPLGQMCAELLEGVAPCTDEGSALVFTQTDYMAIGIMSYGYTEGPCPGTTILFTRLTHYVEWIQLNTEGTGSTTVTAAMFDDY